MNIKEEIRTLKNNEKCIVRTTEEKDAESMIIFLTGLSNTSNYILRYPEECDYQLENEINFLNQQYTSEYSGSISCFVGNEVIGNIGLYRASDRLKLKHRAQIGLGVKEEYRNLGVGSILMEKGIELAKKIGYEQIELDVVSENKAGIALYEKFGFVKTGVYPHGMKLKEAGYYDLNIMVKNLK